MKQMKGRRKSEKCNWSAWGKGENFDTGFEFGPSWQREDFY